jgi:hypothetical protein
VRGLVLACAILVASREAAARRIVIMEPPLARACPNAKSWPLLLDCMKQHGLKATIMRQLDDAKLLAVQSLDAKNGELETWAMYVTAGTGWKLGGLSSSGGNLADTEVLRFERITSGTHHGYRFDIATTQQSAVSLDQATTQTSLLHQTQATFCSGMGYSCMVVVPSCVQLVYGQAVVAFEGTIAVADNLIKLTGAGTPQSCSGAGTFTAMFQ